MELGDDNSVVLHAYGKAVPELTRAIRIAGGDFNEIDFEAVRARWLNQLSAAERDAIEADEKRDECAASFDRVTPDMVAYLRRLGCWNPPLPDSLH